MFDVVVVAYGGAELLRRCLESLHGDANVASVLVVDNLPSDKEVEEACEALGVSRIALPDNPGFGAACNVGVSHGAAEFVLLLNPDAISNAEATASLMGVLQRDPTAAVVGPNLVQPDGTPDWAAKRRLPGVIASMAHLIGVEAYLPYRLRYRMTWVDPDSDPVQVAAVNGAAMMVRRKSYEGAQGFDEGFFMYGEDLDLCARVWNSGYRVIYDGRSSMVHMKGGVTPTSSNHAANRAFYDSLYRFWTKHNAWFQFRLVRVGVRLSLSLAERFSVMPDRKG